MLPIFLGLPKWVQPANGQLKYALTYQTIPRFSTALIHLINLKGRSGGLMCEREVFKPPLPLQTFPRNFSSKRPEIFFLPQKTIVFWTKKRLRI